MPRTILLCDSCLRAIRSRGEKVVELNTLYADDDITPVCEFCQTEADEVCECEFPDKEA